MLFSASEIVAAGNTTGTVTVSRSGRRESQKEGKHMDLSSLHWGSPVGLGFFFAGAGVCFWGLFTGLAAMKRAEDSDRENDE